MRIKVGDLRHIEGLYLKGEISYSRQVEMLNEIANQPDTHYVESILPTEEEIEKDLIKMGWLFGDDIAIDEILKDVNTIIKSRLAGKEEQK
jgi:hypothetical protein